MQDNNVGGNKQYELPQDESFFVDQSSGEVVDSKDLTPFQIIKLTAQQMDIKVQDPRKGCKKCYGRGYVGINTSTKEPVPCRCIYTFEQKQQEAKENKRTFVTRKQRRLMERMFKKQNNGLKIPTEEEAEKINATSAVSATK